MFINIYSGPQDGLHIKTKEQVTRQILASLSPPPSFPLSAKATMEQPHGCRLRIEFSKEYLLDDWPDYVLECCNGGHKEGYDHAHEEVVVYDAYPVDSHRSVLSRIYEGFVEEGVMACKIAHGPEEGRKLEREADIYRRKVLELSNEHVPGYCGFYKGEDENGLEISCILLHHVGRPIMEGSFLGLSNELKYAFHPLIQDWFRSY